MTLLALCRQDDGTAPSVMIRRRAFAAATPSAGSPNRVSVK